MSHIEKALQKVKKEVTRIKSGASSQVHTDTVKAGEQNVFQGNNSSSQKPVELDKESSILDHMKTYDLESPSEEKYGRENSHIMSAVEKKDKEGGAEHIASEGDECDQLMKDSVTMPQERDTVSMKEEDEREQPATTIDTYNVDEHIVSYYESIGKQTWVGPVMVNFRRLQVSLSGLQKNNMCKVMLFTSSQQKEGKSTVSLNTAITLCSDKKKKVAIMDCDFRKPSLNRLLGFTPDKGLSDYLLEEADTEDILYNGIVPNLTMIPVGNKPSNTCELFASDRMMQFVSYIRDQFDCVIIDTPPVLAFPDTVIIAPLSDGVIFVINCKNTRKTIVKRAVETLHASRIMGFIMNMSETAAVDYYGYTSGYYYYDYASS